MTIVTASQEQKALADAYYAVAEADGDAECYWLAAAEYFDLGWYAKAERCRAKARHYRSTNAGAASGDVQPNQPIPYTKGEPGVNGAAMFGVLAASAIPEED